MGRPALWVSFTCGHCGQEAITKPNKLRAGRQYCSHRCVTLANPPPPRFGNKDNWRGDNAKRMAMHARAQKLCPPGPCAVCGGPGTLAHHIDENPWNNALENLQRLCRPCHVRHHQTGQPRRTVPTHCTYGHALEPTTRRTPSGRAVLRCRPCAARRSRESRARRDLTTLLRESIRQAQEQQP